MKVKFVFLLMCLSCALQAQIVYHDAAEFPLLGRGTDAVKARYQRLPDSLENVSRKALWDLGKNSAGMAIRFRSNSTTIKAKWEVLNKFGMGHMTNIGVRGVDLYCMDEGKWYFAGSGTPRGKETEALLVKDMPIREREFMLYLPLYDGTVKVEIGIDSLATISAPQVNEPVRERPVVFYGTSILQGGCATRTGMVATNMIQRDLNVECVNLGFSGEGKMDNYMALAMAEIPGVTAYVLDPIPNCTKDMCKNLTYGFVNTLRKLRPGVPIIMVEGPMYSYTKYDKFTKNYLAQKNDEWRKNYEKLKAEDPNNLYYVTCEGLSGYDNEGTVDGIHFTDLGFRAYADKLIEILKYVVE